MNDIDSSFLRELMRSLTTAVLLALVTSSGSGVHAQDLKGTGRQQLIVDVRSLDLGQAAVAVDRASIQPLDIRGRAVPLTEIAHGETGDGRGAALVERIALDTQVLAPPGPSISVRGGRAGLPPGKTHLSLRIDDKEFVLYVVETVHDRGHPFRHVTAIVMKQAGGAYARFTVDDKARRLVGTLRADDATYRIVPSSPDAETHLVYRLVESAGARGQQYAALSDSIVATPDVATLEERHILAEALAEFQPAGYYIRSPVAVVIWGREGGNDRLPTMAPARAEDPDAIAALIGSLAPLTGARGDERFIIEGVQRTGDGVSIISFRQLLGDLPVRRRQTLELTSAGNVRKLIVTLLDESWLPEGPSTLLTSTVAESIAREALAQHVGGIEGFRIEQVEGSESIGYDIVEFGALAPRWRSAFVIRGGDRPNSYYVNSYYVLTNLQTGEPLVVPAGIRE